MGWGRAAPGAGGALGVAGGLCLLGAVLLLVLLALDVGLSRDLTQLREQQQRLWDGVPELWLRLTELQGRMEQEEREGRQRLLSVQRLGAELLRLREEGLRLESAGGAAEAALRGGLGRLHELLGDPPRSAPPAPPPPRP